LHIIYYTVEQYLEKPIVDEVELAINMLKKGEAPGEDGMAAKLLKRRRKNYNYKN